MYKVNVIAHALKGNRVAYHGDVVSEKDLNGNAADLLKQRFIVKASEKEIKAAQKPADEADKGGEKVLSQMKKDQLIAYAAELKLDISGATNNEARAKAIQDHLDAEKAKGEQ